MTGFRAKQIIFALCLMVSMLAATGSACICSHHEPAPAAESCSSHHQTHDTGDRSITQNTVSEDCVCAAFQAHPSALSKPENKKARPNAEPVATVSTAASPTSALLLLIASRPRVRSDAKKYSADISALLPARAPPRL